MPSGRAGSSSTLATLLLATVAIAAGLVLYAYVSDWIASEVKTGVLVRVDKVEYVGDSTYYIYVTNIGSQDVVIRAVIMEFRGHAVKDELDEPVRIRPGETAILIHDEGGWPSPPGPGDEVTVELLTVEGTAPVPFSLIVTCSSSGEGSRAEGPLAVEDVEVENGWIRVKVANNGPEELTLSNITVSTGAISTTWEDLDLAIEPGEVKTVSLAYAWTYSDTYEVTVRTYEGLVASKDVTLAEPPAQPYALELNGDPGSYVDTGPIRGYTGQELWHITIEFWIKVTKVDQEKRLVLSGRWEWRTWWCRREGPIEVYVWRGQYSGRFNIRFYLPTPGASASVGAYNLWLNRWYHITAIFSSGSWVFYVNGEKTQEGCAMGWDRVTPITGFVIGRDCESPSRAFYGVIDDLRIYNRPLSREEIWNNMRGLITTRGLLLWYRFDERGSHLVHDVSGSGHNGTIYGEPGWVQGVTEEFAPAGPAVEQGNQGPAYHPALPSTSGYGLRDERARG